MLRQSITLFILLLKNQLKRITYVTVLILLPVLIMAASITGIIDYDTSNRVGILVSGDDPVAIGAADILVNGEYMANFKRYDDVDKMKTDIVNGRIDCAYVFPDTLTEDLLNRSKRTVTLYLNDSENIFATYTNEVVFSAFLKAGSGELLEKYMSDSDFLDDEIAHDLNVTFSAYADSDEVFSIIKEDIDTGNGFSVAKAKTDHATVFRFLSAIIIMIAALNGAIKRTGEMKNSAFETMNRNVLRLSCFAYPTAYCLPVAVSLLLTLFAADSSRGAWDIINFLLLVITCGIFAGVLGLLIKSPRVLAGTVPVLIMLMFFIYPVLLDFSMFSQIIVYVRYIFPPGYINIVG